MIRSIAGYHVWRRVLTPLVLTYAATACGSDEPSPSGSGGTSGAGSTDADAGVGGSGGVGGAGGLAGMGGSSGAGGRAGGGASSGAGGAAGVADSGAADRGGGDGRFSFFVTSLNALRRLSGSDDGFGGDLTYGETGEGAGLRGADKICTEIAESSMAGAGAKTWRAFLSAPTGGTNGGPANAIDRIGEGPWYDRQGRLFASSKANLNGFRPLDADPAIKNDFPNETGTPNHNPDGTGAVDNHDTLTGSTANGTIYTGSANPTCSGWTSKVGSAGKPRVGHAWPRSANMMSCGANGCYGHWVSSLDEAGCAPGVFIVEMGGPKGDTVGGGGGYGGFYCFALTP